MAQPIAQAPLIRTSIPMTQTLILYGIPNCDTVKAARLWLRGHAVPHEFHDFKKQGVPTLELDQWLEHLGWERVLNRQGTTWRSLDEATRSRAVDVAGVRGLLLAHPSLIKRPITRWPDGQLSLGFLAADWQAMLAAAST